MIAFNAYSPVPAPEVSVVVPQRPLYTGTNLTLTCDITLSEDVNTAVDVTATWTGPSGALPDDVIMTDAIGSESSYQSTITFAPLTMEHGGSYTCEVTIAPAETTAFITMSQPGSVVGTVIVSGRNTPWVPVLYVCISVFPLFQPFRHQRSPSLLMALQLLDSRTLSPVQC